MDMISSWLAQPAIRRALMAAAAVVIVAILARVINRSLTRFVQDPDLRYRARKTTTFAGYVVGALVVVAIFSGNLGAFGVTVGVIGAGIAFALQEVIASVAGWVSVGFGGLYRVGDRIQIAGVRGDVIDIGILRTTLMECGEWVNGDLYDGRIVRIGNSFVFKGPVFNYSADFPFLWDEILVPIRHGSDVARTRALLLEATTRIVGAYTDSARDAWGAMVRNYRIEDASVDPIVSMVFDENRMTFTARYIVHYLKRRSTKDAIATGILTGIEQTGGAIRIATAAFEISDGSVVTIRNASP